MMRRIAFSKLVRTGSICPSQWEMFFDDGCAVCVAYSNDHLTVHISPAPVSEIIDCLHESNLVLSKEDLLQSPDCGSMSDDVLFEVLSAYDLLEKE